MLTGKRKKERKKKKETNGSVYKVAAQLNIPATFQVSTTVSRLNNIETASLFSFS